MQFDACLKRVLLRGAVGFAYNQESSLAADFVFSAQPASMVNRMFWSSYNGASARLCLRPS
jgi:hypothetical protein